MVNAKKQLYQHQSQNVVVNVVNQSHNNDVKNKKRTNQKKEDPNDVIQSIEPPTYKTVLSIPPSMPYNPLSMNNPIGHIQETNKKVQMENFNSHLENDEALHHAHESIKKEIDEKHKTPFNFNPLTPINPLFDDEEPIEEPIQHEPIPIHSLDIEKDEGPSTSQGVLKSPGSTQLIIQTNTLELQWTNRVRNKNGEQVSERIKDLAIQVAKKYDNKDLLEHASRTKTKPSPQLLLNKIKKVLKFR